MIRNFIWRQMNLNRYGLFQFLKKQVSEHQKQFLELQSQYKNTQNVDQQIELMKGIINVRHLIDEQDNVSLETIQSYLNFIRDCQTCERKGLKINKETIEIYNQVYQRFIDQTIFDKISENSMFSQSKVDIKYLQLNSLIYLFQKKYELREFESMFDINIKIFEVIQELKLQTSGSIQIQVSILEFQQTGFLLQIHGQFIEAGAHFQQGLDQIKQLKQYYDNHSIEITQSDKEWLFSVEVNIYENLAHIFNHLDQSESCIEYQDKALQLIKDYEGISYFYINRLYYFNNQFGSLNFFRQLKIIEETCSNLEKNEQQLLLQFQRLKVILKLDQLNKKEYDRIIKLHQEVQIIDDNFHTAFYSIIMICAIRLKYYSDINKWTDLMFSYISNITYNQIVIVATQMLCLHQEFQNTQLKHSKNVYEKTILYYKEKTYPFFAEIQKEFAENYFNLSVVRQIEINDQMLLILRDYITRSQYDNEDHLIRVALENIFKLFQDNHNYREPILQIFLNLNADSNIPPQEHSQLSIYIQQLQQDSHQ